MADTLSPNYAGTHIPQFSDPLLQRFFQSKSELYDRENGKKIIRGFYMTQTSNSTSLNYFRLRNARWIELLLWAKGSQKMAEFLPFMGVQDANKSWLNIDMEQSRIASQFLGTVVESMAKNRLKPIVKAIDDASMNQKAERMFDAIYRMHDVETITGLQQKAGMNFEPPNAYVPDDELSARVHYELVDQLPKEIRFEQIMRRIQDEVKFDQVLNRKTIFDLAVHNFGFVKIEKSGPGKYLPRKGIPTNMVYNFFLNDIGKIEITEIGEFTNIKVKDIRRLFGKSAQNPDGLEERDIFEMCKLSVTRNVGTFNYMWDQNWAQTTYYLNRPYDDYSIFVLDCEIWCGEELYYVEKKDQYGRPAIEPRASVPYQQVTKKGVINQEKPDNVEIIKREGGRWMRGVFAPYGDYMLYWGDPDVRIQDYTDSGKTYSSWSVVACLNDGEYSSSLFERIMEPLREYQLIKLTRKKLISQIKPSEIRIDVESARNIDLGGGNVIPWEEILKIYNQTGVELYSSKGIDALQPQPPALANPLLRDQSIQKIIGLTEVMNGILLEIRQLIGVPSYRDGSDVGDRTAAQLAESQNQSSFNVTDYILDYDILLWEDVFEKLCLLYWNDAVQAEPESQDDMLNTRFRIGVKLKLTDLERRQMEQDITRYSQMTDKNGNPLLSPKDATMLREIDNYKLFCMYLDSVTKQNQRQADQEIQNNAQANAQVQQQSNAQASQQAQALQAQKLDIEKQMAEYKALQDIKVEVVRGIMLVASKGMDAQLPPWLSPVLEQLVPNISMTIAQDNKMIAQGMVQQAQAEQQQAMQQQAQAQQIQQANGPQQPMQQEPQPQQPQPQMASQ